MIGMDIARSGLTASMMRLNASASNVANADSVGSTAAKAASANPGQAPYQPLTVNQQAMTTGGVATTYAKVQPGSVLRYEPSSSLADAQGMVAAPNVDLVDETVQQIVAQSDFQANIAVVRVGDEMEKSTIDLLA